MFEDFPYNHAEEAPTRKRFSEMENIEIRKENFYSVTTKTMFDITMCDILIVDIGNMRKTYEFFIKDIYPHLKHGSLSILEGGSIERDNYYKSKGYSNESINEFLQSCSVPYCILSSFPSITLFSR